MIHEIKEFVNENLELLWDEYKRTLHPEDYPVDLSEACWNNKMEKIEEVKDKVAKMKIN